MKLILTILIALFQAIIVIIPISGRKLADKRFNRLKLLTFNGWIVCLLCLFSGIATIYLFKISENDSNEFNQKVIENNTLNERKIEKMHQLYIGRLDSSNKHTIGLLAKYGLEQNIQNDLIIRKIDTQESNVQPNLMAFSKKEEWEEVDNKRIIPIGFINSGNAVAYKIKSTYRMFHRYQETYTIDDAKPFISQHSLGIGESISKKVRLLTQEHNFPDTVYFVLSVKFESFKREDSYYNRVYRSIYSQKVFTLIETDFYVDIKKFLRSKGL